MADTFTQLTANTDTLSFDESDLTESTVNATSAFINTEDQVDLGGGYDILALYGGGNLDLRIPSSLTGIDEIQIINAGYAPVVHLRDGMTAVVTTDGSTYGDFYIGANSDISFSVTGYSYIPTLHVGTGSNVTLDLSSAIGGNYYLSDGTAVIDGADSGGNYDSPRYYFSSGTATVSNANSSYNYYYLSSGAATIDAGGTFDPYYDGGNNAYFLGSGAYTLNGADSNLDTFTLNDAAQLQAGSLINGGTGSYVVWWNGSPQTINDAVVFGGAGQVYDLTQPHSTVFTEIERYLTTGDAILKVDQASITGISILSGNITTDEDNLDLSGIQVSGSVTSGNVTGTIFTVTDAGSAAAISGGAGSDTIIATGITLTTQQKAAIFLNGSIETIIDDSGTYAAPLQLTANTDTLSFDESDLTESTVNATSAFINTEDQVDLGGGYDILALYGGGNLDLRIPSSLTGIDEIQIINAGYAPVVHLRDGMTAVVTTDGSTYGDFYIGANSDISFSVTGYSYIPTLHVGTGSNVTLDLSSAIGGNYYLSDGTAVIDGADSGGNYDSPRYYFSSGTATVSNANSSYNYYYLSSGAATIDAGGTFDPYYDGGNNAYFLGSGAYTLNGADSNLDTFTLNDAAQLQAGSLINGGTGSYVVWWNGSPQTINDAVVFGGAGQVYDLTQPHSTVFTEIERYLTTGDAILKVDQASITGISILSGNITTDEDNLDLSGIQVSGSVTSGNVTGTIFTVTDAGSAAAISGGAGSDTIIATGITLTTQQKAAIFLNGSIETIIDDSGTYAAPLQLTANTDTLSFDESDLTESTVNATSAFINTEDQVDLGGGYDILALYGGGNLDLRIPSSLTGIDEIQIINAGYAPVVHLRDGMTAVVTTDGSTYGDFYIGANSDISFSVTGYSYIPTLHVGTGSNVTLDLSSAIGGNYYLSDGTAVIDGADSGGNYNSPRYYFSSGTATVSNANSSYNYYYLSSGAATIDAGGTFDPYYDGGNNAYFLGSGAYTLNGADSNLDTFTLNDAAQLQAGSLINGGTGSYVVWWNGSPQTINDAVVFGGAGQVYDLTQPHSTVFTEIERYLTTGDAILKVDQASITGISILSGNITTDEDNLDLSGIQVSGSVTSGNVTGTIFTVTDAGSAAAISGGAGSDTIIATGITLTTQQKAAIFLNGSIETIIDDSGTYSIEEINQPPTTISLDTSSIDENSTPQTLVGVLTADDPDAGDTATFTLLDNAGGLFEIVNGNELVLADGAVLDFESAGSHSVTVRVTDSAGLYLDQTFSIDVNDLNEEPSSLTFTGDTVSEAAAEGDVVGVLNAADPDAGDTLTYTLMDDAGGLFVLDGNQVKVATGASFDFETADSHTISVDVTDAGGLIRSETFVITLGDVNEAPDSLTITGSEVEENAAAGTVVSSLDATDPDTGDTLSFSLSDDAGGRFVVVGNEVQVADGASLDFEDQNSHDITVVVTDSLGLTRSETVTITVANVDEAPTDLTISATEVDENAAAGSVVATLTAIDPDGADGLAFALVDDAGGLFDIQNDQILVAAGALIDFETQSSHDITVEVTDPSGLSYQKTFTITVIDSNEAPTDIVVTGGTVLENAAEGTVVATLSAVDQDIGETLTYAIADTSGLFEIVDNQIRVAAGAAIDYETQTSHGVTVSVTDSAGNSYEEELTIVVQNVSGNIIGTNAANTLNGTSEEDFIDGRGGNDTMSGADGNDQILGGAGNDRLIGGLGADTLIGGLNDDTYVLSGNDVLEDTIVEDPGQGTDTVETDQSYTLGANLEKLVLTGTSSINGTGNALANTLTGNSGDNILDGAAGSDTMIGGAGSDIYYVDAGDIVTEGNTVGTDEVRTALSAYTLGTNIENLTYIGSGSFTGTGNTAANTMTGGSGADSLDGGSGNDTMIGLGGNDTYIVAQTGDQVVEAFNGGIDTVNAAITYALAANVEKLVLTGTGSINGTGNDLANTITGNSGANVLNGGLGVDTLSGGTGNDTYVIDDLGDSVVENVASGTDIVRTSLLSYVLDANVENLTFTGIGNFSGTGNALVNTITGGSGDDTLDGGAGVDRLIGGAGNDTYIVDASTETITEGSGAGIDTVIASVTMALAANVENLTLVTTAAINGTGNGLNNVITGNSAANTLSGAAGIDRLIGGGGNDILNGGTGNDVFVFASGFGNDTIQDFDYNPSGGQDLIDLSGFGITAATFASRVILADLGADIRLTIDGNAAQTITLTGAQNISNITVADFVL